MKIFDMHVHAKNTAAEPERLLSQLEKAGVWGCSVISNRPKEMSPDVGSDFDVRLNEILNWTKGYEDRLVPILWVHPFEEDILKKIETASEAGVAAFKVICNNFFVGENKSMDMLEKTDRIENKFHNNFYYKKSWSLSNQPEKVSDGVNPYREEYLDKTYPGIRDNEYKKTE